jgi:hypothetical protein
MVLRIGIDWLPLKKQNKMMIRKGMECGFYDYPDGLSFYADQFHPDI